MNRNCNNCTKCCEGWTKGNVKGYDYYRGKPCHFVKINVGCSIYKDRPKEQCVDYNCEWLVNEEIPEWMKPNYTHVVINKIEEEGYVYFKCIEAGKKMSVNVLNWLFLYYIKNNINLLYQIDGGWHWIGSKNFVNYIKERVKQF